MLFGTGWRSKMVKLVYLNYAQLEYDTETGKTRIMKAWSTVGKPTKKPKVQSTIENCGEVVL